jgi:hypothetical protein
MKLFQFITSLLALIFTILAVVKVFESEQYNAIEYLILSHASMFVAVIFSTLIKNQENGKDR